MSGRNAVQLSLAQRERGSISVGCIIAGLLSDDHRWVNAENIEVAGGDMI